jgi:hypothetical protein
MMQDASRAETNQILARFYKKSEGTVILGSTGEPARKL